VADTYGYRSTRPEPGNGGLGAARRGEGPPSERCPDRRLVIVVIPKVCADLSVASKHTTFAFTCILSSLALALASTRSGLGLVHHWLWPWPHAPVALALASSPQPGVALALYTCWVVATYLHHLQSLFVFSAADDLHLQPASDRSNTSVHKQHISRFHCKHFAICSTTKCIYLRLH